MLLPAGWLQGTDRWQSASLFDPTDAGAGGFYSLNAYNTCELSGMLEASPSS